MAHGSHVTPHAPTALCRQVTAGMAGLTLCWNRVEPLRPACLGLVSTVVRQQSAAVVLGHGLVLLPCSQTQDVSKTDNS
jgi:hypothetical protein